MFPLYDDNPTSRVAVVTIAIIALNVLTWLVVQGLGGEPYLSRSVCDFGLIPGALLGRVPVGTAIPIGGEEACIIGRPNWLTPLTSMFMHGSWFHLIGNMWFLWVFGDNVEDRLGHFSYLVFYLVCGIGAGLAHVVMNLGSRVPSLGASGAISGVLGAYIMLYPGARVLTLMPLIIFWFTVEIPAFIVLGWWFLIQFLSGISSVGARSSGGTAWWAHIGGFLLGVGLVKIWPQRRRRAWYSESY